MKEEQKGLDGLIQEVMEQMEDRRYGKKIVTRYRSSFQLLMSVSQETGNDRLSEKLIKAFLDRPISCNETWAQKELAHRKRCIRLLLSLAQTGSVDGRRQDTGSSSEKLMNKGLRLERESFVGYFSGPRAQGPKRCICISFNRHHESGGMYTPAPFCQERRASRCTISRCWS